MIRRIVPPVALVVGSVLLTLLLGEALLRTLGYQPRQIVLNPNFWITGWAEMDPELGWKNRQGSFRSVEPGNALMSFEADGRRHDPIGSKGPNVPKILVVGCSFTQGEGIPDNEPYPHVINRALPDFEALNFGTGGYGTYQSLLRMRSYFRASHPPTPLVIYGLNHATRNVATADWVSLLTTRDGRYLVSMVRLAAAGATSGVVFAAVVGSVAGMNYVRYGAFTTNEFKSASFLSAYGAISRIRHAEWQRYVVFPKEAREKAYAVSPAALELRPVLDGEYGEAVRRFACKEMRRDPCPETPGGWHGLAGNRDGG